VVGLLSVFLVVEVLGGYFGYVLGLVCKMDYFGVVMVEVVVYCVEFVVFVMLCFVVVYLCDIECMNVLVGL